NGMCGIVCIHIYITVYRKSVCVCGQDVPGEASPLWYVLCNIFFRVGCELFHLSTHILCAISIDPSVRGKVCVCVCVCVCLCVCVCVCVFFLREKESERERAVCNIRWYDCMSIVEGVSMYVCECLCVWRRERERERKRDIGILYSIFYALP